MQIAARHVGTASRARARTVEPLSFESAESATLSAEFQDSLVAIAAVAFAMEALELELEGAGHQLDNSKFIKPTRTNKGFYVAQRLIQVFKLDKKFEGRLPSQLQDLFELRHESVHFKSLTKHGTKPHPSGTNTAEELTVFTLERSIEAVRLGREILKECLESIKLGHHASATAVVRELPGVLKMLDEVLSSEGISLA